MLDAIKENQLRLLIHHLRPGATYLSSARLEGGMAADMYAIEFESQDDAREKIVLRLPKAWVLKENPSAAHDDFRLLRKLYDSGLSVAHPLLLDDPPRFFSTPALAMEFVDGTVEYNPDDRYAYASSFADLLFRVHSATATAFEFLPRKWFENPRDFEFSANQLDEAQREGEVREALKSAICSRELGPLSLLHGDLWAGNVIWRPDGGATILDWEEARLGNPLWDVAVTRVEHLLLFGREAMESFTSMYQRISGADLSDLAFWDLWASLRPMSCFGPWAERWPGLGRPDITEESIRHLHLEFVENALGRLT